MTDDGSRRDMPMAIVHGALLLVVTATGLYDMAIADVSGLYIGPLLPLVVAVVGFARHRRGRRDGRGMMAAADTAFLLIVVLYLQLDRPFVPGHATITLALLIVLAVAGLVTIAIARTPPRREPIVRSAMHRRGLVAYAAIVSGIPIYQSGFELPLATMLVVANASRRALRVDLDDVVVGRSLADGPRQHRSVRDGALERRVWPGLAVDRRCGRAGGSGPGPRRTTAADR